MRRLTLIAAALALFTGTAAAQSDYPTRPITVIVPFTAGGPTDTVARLVAEPMTQAAGPAGHHRERRRRRRHARRRQGRDGRPDGYTLLLHHIGQATAPRSTASCLQYAQRLRVHRLINEVPMTHDRQARPAGEQLRRADPDGSKTNKGKINLANAGLGAASHLCGLLLQSTAQAST